MRIVLATRALDWVGGSETYLTTVGEHLERLGHHVVLYAPQLGEMAEAARARGLRVHGTLADAGEADAALAQDSIVAYEVAERHPGIPLLFVAHSDFALQSPPQLPDVAPVAVALNERVARHLRSLGTVPEILRLHQPVDLSRFGPLGTNRPRPRRVLAFGSNLAGGRERLIAAACRRAGLELQVVGLPRRARVSFEPERELSRAEIVIGVGRCAIEGMASGKAVYVYGPAGGDGWVTPEAYPVLEADGFSGRASETVVDVERLASDLAGFSLVMGQRNRDLAAAHHDALAHARSLVEAWRTIGASAPPPVPADELARLTRLQRQAEETAQRFARDSQRARFELERLRSSRRFRAGSALAAPLDAVREVRARRRRPPAR